jgi:carboxylesterase
MRTRYFYIILTVISFIGCNPTPEIDNATMLDGDQIFDTSLDNPKKY